MAKVVARDGGLLDVAPQLPLQPGSIEVTLRHITLHNCITAYTHRHSHTHTHHVHTYTCKHAYVTLHYITLPYVPLQYSALHYGTVHYITVLCITLQYCALHYSTVHCIILYTHNRGIMSVYSYNQLLISNFGETGGFFSLHATNDENTMRQTKDVQVDRNAD